MKLLWMSLLFLIPLFAQGTPLNRPITDEVFYFIMTDRFENGDRQNDKGFDRKPYNDQDSLRDIMRHGYLPTDKGFYHGGDFKGIIKRLDYIQGLGVTSLWLSPIQKNQPVQGDGSIGGSSAGYHGYWITDFTTVDPHLGTEEDFKQLVDEAHKRGMKVFIDVITNHTADIISYHGCGDCPYRSRADYPYVTNKRGKTLNQGFVDGDLSKENFAKLTDPNFAYSPYVRDEPGEIKKPAWLNDVIYYHNRGNSTFSGENSLYGDFFGLDDLFTEHPRVVEGMIDIYKEWIRKYKIDGFRIDTVKHVNIEFWQQFVPAIRDYAKEQGIPHFFMFGEVFSAEPKILSKYTRDGRLDSVLDFAFQGSAKDIFADQQNLDKFANIFNADDLHRISSHPNHMLTFISNHDIGRLGHFILEAKNKGKFKLDPLRQVRLAHSFMFFARGVPVIYYGDEQGFTGDGGDKDARENMFPSQVDDYNDNKLLGTKKTTKDENFDPKHPLYRDIAKFSEIYKSHPVLRNGEQHNLASDQDGVFAFIRTLPELDDEYLVAFNLGAKPARLKWSRQKISDVFQGKIQGKNIIIAPQDFTIVKAPKESARLSNKDKAKVSLPEEDARVSGLFPFEVQIPGNGYHTVKFSMVDLKTNAETPLIVDHNRPYRAYIDSKDIPAGSKIRLRAEITPEGGSSFTLERETTVDGRTPTVFVHYENGNKRSEAFHVLSNGLSSFSQKVGDNGSYRFSWPNGVAGAMLLFSSREKGLSTFDQPIYIDFKNDVINKLKASDTDIVAHIYVNNQHEISDKPFSDSSKNPATLPYSPKAKAPFGQETLYVRGGMNAWQATTPLEYLGNFTYATSVELSSGLMEYKFADKSWTAQANFGAPISSEEGLQKSGGSGNLKLLLDENQKGTYRFELIHIPKEHLKNSKLDLSFFKISRL